MSQVFLEDAGFDWKILGPDVSEADYVAWTCDQDAYACSGQKCSAQSILFMHANWAKAGGLPWLLCIARGRCEAAPLLSSKKGATVVRRGTSFFRLCHVEKC